MTYLIAPSVQKKIENALNTSYLIKIKVIFYWWRHSTSVSIDRLVDVPAPRPIWEPRDEGSFNGVKSLIENELTCTLNKH